jgi:hypothetical protein
MCHGSFECDCDVSMSANIDVVPMVHLKGDSEEVPFISLMTFCSPVQSNTTHYIDKTRYSR